MHCFEKVGHCDSVEGHVVALVLWEFSLGIMARLKRADVGGLTPVFGRLGSIFAAPLAAVPSPDAADRGRRSPNTCPAVTDATDGGNQVGLRFCVITGCPTDGTDGVLKLFLRG